MAAKHVLETSGLSHRFSDGAAVLHGLNLQLPEGSIYGFLGANGAGKTTTLRLVLGDFGFLAADVLHVQQEEKG